MQVRRFAIVLSGLLIATLVAASPAGARSRTFHRPIVVIGAHKSSNWSGYNQGTLEGGAGMLFSSVSGTWKVPTARPHKAGEAEYSSTWVGIGGGCVDAACNVTDSTLIQAGTEQDVTKSGAASYSAWWELIPAPSVKITSVPVRAGDSITVTIGEAVPGSNVWTIVLKNATTGKTFTMTTPYSSTHATAEWIVETPIVFGGGGVQVGPMPSLSTVNFDLAKTNGWSAGLRSTEEIQLVAGGQVLATPSSPDSDADGFNDCTYASTCGAPRSS